MNIDFDKLDGIEAYLCDRVIGQSHVMPQIAQLVRHAEMGQTRSWEPLCRMLFVGSTGVGKTLTAKVISRYVLGANAYHQLDMSEFMLKESVENFIGDKSGDLGRLGRILEIPGKKLLLFDEIEKAHTEIMNLFLQMLEEGHITVGRGTKLTLNNCYIIVTTNIGSDKIIKADSEYTNHAILEQVCRAEFGRKFGMEKIERFQAFCVFVKLSQADQLKITRLELKAEIEHQRTLGNQLDFDQSAIDFLYNVGCSELYGARPLRNQTTLHVRNAVTSLILQQRTGTVTGRLTANPEQTQLLVLSEPNTNNKWKEK